MLDGGIWVLSSCLVLFFQIKFSMEPSSASVTINHSVLVSSWGCFSFTCIYDWYSSGLFKMLSGACNYSWSVCYVDHFCFIGYLVVWWCGGHHVFAWWVLDGSWGRAAEKSDGVMRILVGLVWVLYRFRSKLTMFGFEILNPIPD